MKETSRNNKHNDVLSVAGNYTEMNGELYYKISNYDKMLPFFMTIVSHSDHWIFISSNGGLTAGRKNPDNALFPYYNDDYIHTCHATTGSKTIFQIEDDGKKVIWEPFSEYQRNLFTISRNIYKNIPGNKIIFEEENHTVGLSFLYSWSTSEKYGFIKSSRIINKKRNALTIKLLDGIQNILPNGIYQQFQIEFSTLADGYKKNELISDTGIGLYSLSSIPSDKAEPSESLRATVVWAAKIEAEKYLLSSRQLDNFRDGINIETEIDIKGTKGSYFVETNFELSGGSDKDWFIISDINYDISQIEKLRYEIKASSEIASDVVSDINAGTERLVELVAKADGRQLTSDRLSTSRHFSNVLFNIMRGGIFPDSYQIQKNDFLLYVSKANKRVFNKHFEILSDLSRSINYFNLIRKVREVGDNELIKVAYEYLPLSFSRRHGDPSRPWNRFSIEIKDEKNQKLLNYQGNWRDIFQNWEALSLSFPGYLESMIFKFLNASTADGYNPYRITKFGIDWEIPEPDMPWSNIGYWGDHQIIYLLKLLELSSEHFPDSIKTIYKEKIFTYANVPYRIKKYEELLKNSKSTIDFDHELNDQIISEEKAIGSDARFLHDEKGKLYLVNLVEKLLVALLSKISNFVPEGGIWMNTQRPEWNDANNALVGNGVSMVTLYYLRRYVNYLKVLFSEFDDEHIELSQCVYILFEEINRVFETSKHVLTRRITNKERKSILDGLGEAGSRYRGKIYTFGFSNHSKNVQINEIIEFLKLTNRYIDHTIEANRRPDGLFHSYNLMSVAKSGEISLSYLYEMLEGQVAVLSSGYLSAERTVDLLKALRASDLYRQDQNSYLLYPERQLPLFIEKNIIPAGKVESSDFLKKLSKSEISEIVTEDINGNLHFNGDIKNSHILQSKLNELKNTSKMEISESETEEILDIYESVFNHKSFTGRSGTFYKYEGLGSIYWHMVSKLVLAVQEVFINSRPEKKLTEVQKQLRDYYFEIKAGIGIHKTPDEYGAFPTDPYSHTPSFSGVQQPGMTGQVKEDIISRFRELGVIVSSGKIIFNSFMIDKNEFLHRDEKFNFINYAGESESIQLNKGSLAFTYCQTPVIYILSDKNMIKVTGRNSEEYEINGNELSRDISVSIFLRKGEYNKIQVYIDNKSV